METNEKWQQNVTPDHELALYGLEDKWEYLNSMWMLDGGNVSMLIFWFECFCCGYLENVLLGKIRYSVQMEHHANDIISSSSRGKKALYSVLTNFLLVWDCFKRKRKKLIPSKWGERNKVEKEGRKEGKQEEMKEGKRKGRRKEGKKWKEGRKRQRDWGKWKRVEGQLWIRAWKTHEVNPACHLLLFFPYDFMDKNKFYTFKQLKKLKRIIIFVAWKLHEIQIPVFVS